MKKTCKENREKGHGRTISSTYFSETLPNFSQGLSPGTLRLGKWICFQVLGTQLGTRTSGTAFGEFDADVGLGCHRHPCPHWCKEVEHLVWLRHAKNLQDDGHSN